MRVPKRARLRFRMCIHIWVCMYKVANVALRWPQNINNNVYRIIQCIRKIQLNMFGITNFWHSTVSVVLRRLYVIYREFRRDAYTENNCDASQYEQDLWHLYETKTHTVSCERRHCKFCYFTNLWKIILFSCQLVHWKLKKKWNYCT